MWKKTKSATSTTNRTSYNSLTNTKDQRVAADNGAIVNRQGVINVNTVDGGAIEMAGEVSERAINASELFAEMSREITRDGLNFSKEIAGESLGLAVTSMGSTIDTLEAVIDRERDDAAQLSEQLVNMIPYAVVGLVAWSIFK